MVCACGVYVFARPSSVELSRAPLCVFHYVHNVLGGPLHTMQMQMNAKWFWQTVMRCRVCNEWFNVSFYVCVFVRALYAVSSSEKKTT